MPCPWIVERIRAGDLLGDFDPRIVVQIEVVERATLERRLTAAMAS